MLFSSGWNWTPTNQGWSGRSTISGSSPSGLMPGEDQAALLERVLVVDVDLVAVAVALADRVGAVDRANDAVAVEPRLIGAEPHGAAEIAVGLALLQALLAHPFGDQADDRLAASRRTRSSSRLRCRRCSAPPRCRPSACRGRCRRTALCARGRSARWRSCLRCRARRSRRGRGCRASARASAAISESGCSNSSASSQRMLTLTRLAMPPWTSASFSDLVGVRQADIFADHADRHLALGVDSGRRCRPSAPGRARARR